MTQPTQSLSRAEAEARFALLQVTSYDLALDLTRSAESFTSRSQIAFVSKGGETFLDVAATEVLRIEHNGREIDPAQVRDGRLSLTTVAGNNVVVVEAVMPFRNDGEGLHRSVDPADGRAYVYGMCFMEAAPTVFACFDQPDLKAPYTLQVTADPEWVVFANGPGRQVEPGRWEFDTTPPLSTYFVTLVAGPWHVVTDEHDGIPLSLSVRASMADDLEADELFTITKQCFDEYHRLFGIRYPFGNYHQAFVPEFNAGAMENPGCVTYRDTYVFSSKVTRGDRIMRAVTMAHEMAHQWFGNITTPKWWDDLWLNESFAEYMGNRVIASVTQYDDAWLHDAHVRRQWGLTADQRPSTHPVAGNGAVTAAAALHDFDGISYAKGSSILRQLNTRMGDDVFFNGVIDHFTRHRFANATMHDLFESWQRAGAVDLDAFAEPWLRTAGPDALWWDRDAQALVRTPPAAFPAEREHTFRVALGPQWHTEEVTLSQSRTTKPWGADTPVLIDPWLQTWSANAVDATTLDALITSLAGVDDPLMRAGAWNSVRTSYLLGLLDPGQVAELLVEALPDELSESAILVCGLWGLGRVFPLVSDGGAALSRFHVRMLEAANRAASGSTHQLALLQNAIAAADDETLLRHWLTGRNLPAGMEVDVDLTWAMLNRLATLGLTERGELDAALAEQPTTSAQVEHSRAAASLPTAEAKQWAWQRLTGEVSVSNYELEAAGLGLWRWGQDALTQPYVERYFEALPGLGKVHRGWVLGTAARAFFPMTSPDSSLSDKAHSLIASASLDPAVRRALIDLSDDLARLQHIRATYGSADDRG